MVPPVGMVPPVVVHVWSDISCPWCYIGKRRFERAVATAGCAVEVEHHSFELSPDAPVEFDGTIADFLAHHKGISPEQAEGMLDQVTELAAAEGLRYDFASVRPTRTHLAHQALHHARARGRQAELVERLFRAYFEEGRHVGRVAELAHLAADVGLDGEEMRQVLDEGRYADAVEQDVRAAAQLGIRGVPFFVVDGRYGVSGAQSPEVFTSVLQRALEDRAGATDDAVRVDAGA